jgi:DNA-binding CsgD family transcriptional regulator
VYERGQAIVKLMAGEHVWEYEFQLGQMMPVDLMLEETESMLVRTMNGTSFRESSRSEAEPGAVSPELSRHQTMGSGREFELTRRELEVLAMLCQRLTDPEIAARLFISPRTASSHVSNVMGKLGAANRREAAGIAVRERLV